MSKTLAAQKVKYILNPDPLSQKHTRTTITRVSSSIRHSSLKPRRKISRPILLNRTRVRTLCQWDSPDRWSSNLTCSRVRNAPFSFSFLLSAIGGLSASEGGGEGGLIIKNFPRGSCKRTRRHKRKFAIRDDISDLEKIGRRCFACFSAGEKILPEVLPERLDWGHVPAPFASRNRVPRFDWCALKKRKGKKEKDTRSERKPRQKSAGGIETKSLGSDSHSPEEHSIADRYLFPRVSSGTLGWLPDRGCRLAGERWRAENQKRNTTLLHCRGRLVKATRTPCRGAWCTSAR